MHDMQKVSRADLLQGALSDRNQTGPQCLGLDTQAAYDIANLHLLKLVAPLTLFVHVTAYLTN